MARPAGHRLSASAWEDVLRLSGLQLTQVAERAGLPRATLSSLLGGHHKASIPVAKQLSDALGVHPETLFPTLHPAVEAAA